MSNHFHTTTKHKPGACPGWSGGATYIAGDCHVCYVTKNSDTIRQPGQFTPPCKPVVIVAQHGGETRPAASKKPAKAKMPTKRLRLDCIHRPGRIHPDHVGKGGPPTDPTGRPRQCGKCVVYACDIHGKCTLGTKFKGTACCAEGHCTDYVSEAAEDP